MTEAFKYLNDLFEVGAIEPFSQSAPYEGKPDQNPMWLNGQTGMLWNWSSIYAGVKANIKNLSLALPPIDPNAKQTGIVVRPSQLIAINKDSKNIDEAAKFLNWFFTDTDAIKTLKDVRGVPATADARKILSENNLLDSTLTDNANQAMEKMVPPENGISGNQELEKINTDIIQELAYKKITPEQAADELINTYKQKLPELKSQQ